MLSPKGSDNYDWTPEKKEKIWGAIRRIKPDLVCPICQRQTWEMPDGFVSVPLLSNYWLDKRSSGLAGVALVCETCGYTIIFNLAALGLRELVTPDMDEMRKRWGLSKD